MSTNGKAKSKSSVSSTSIYPLEILDRNSGTKRLFYLHDGLFEKEFVQLFKIAFPNHANIIQGFQDEKGIYYPFSSVSLQPKIFDNKRIFLVSTSLTSPTNSKTSISPTRSSLNDSSPIGSQARQMFRRLDLNQDGLLQPEEFVSACSSYFTHFLNKNPILQAIYELIPLQNLSLTLANVLFDNNRVKSINFVEFAHWWKIELSALQPWDTLQQTSENKRSYCVWHDVWNLLETAMLSYEQEAMKAKRSKNSAKSTTEEVVVPYFEKVQDERDLLSFISLSNKIMKPLLPDLKTFLKTILNRAGTQYENEEQEEDEENEDDDDDEAYESVASIQVSYAQFLRLTVRYFVQPAYITQSSSLNNSSKSSKNKQQQNKEKEIPSSVQQILQRWMDTLWYCLTARQPKRSEVEVNNEQRTATAVEQLKVSLVNVLTLYWVLLMSGSSSSSTTSDRDEEVSAYHVQWLCDLYRGGDTVTAADSVFLGSAAGTQNPWRLVTKGVQEVCSGLLALYTFFHPLLLGGNSSNTPSNSTSVVTHTASVVLLKTWLVCSSSNKEEEAAESDARVAEQLDLANFFVLLRSSLQMVNLDILGLEHSVVIANLLTHLHSGLLVHSPQPQQPPSSAFQPSAGGYDNNSWDEVIGGNGLDNSSSLDEEELITSTSIAYSGGDVSVRHARDILGLVEYTSSEVLHYFAQLLDRTSVTSTSTTTSNTTSGSNAHTKPHLLIPRDRFTQAFMRLIGEHYVSLTVLERSIVDFLVDRLTAFFEVPLIPLAADTQTNSNSSKKKHGKVEGNNGPERRGYRLLELSTAFLLYCEDEPPTNRATVLHTFVTSLGEYNTLTTAAGAQNSNRMEEDADTQDLPLTFHLLKHLLTCLFTARAALDPALPSATCLSTAERLATAFLFTYIMQHHLGSGGASHGDIGMDSSPLSSKVKSTSSSLLFTKAQFIQCLTEAFAHLEQDQVPGLNSSSSSTHQQQADEPSYHLHNSTSSYKAFSEDEGDDDAYDEYDEDNGLRYFRNDKKYPPNAVVLELRAASSILGLELYKADNLLDQLGHQYGSEGGKLHRKGWASWLASVLQESQVSEMDLDLAIFLGHRLFDAFQHDEAGQIAHFSHLAAGLAFLCTASPIAERLMVAFTVLDSDMDGYITFSEFCMMIKSVITVLSVCSKLVMSKISMLSVTHAELSYACAIQGIQVIGMEEEDLLSLDMIVDLAEDYLKLASFI